MSDITIGGRRLEDIIAGAQSAAAAPIAPNQPTMTERDGAFDGDLVSVRVEVPIGRLLLHPSPDERWHLKIAHDVADRVAVAATPTSLELTVEPGSHGAVVSGSSFSFGRTVIVQRLINLGSTFVSVGSSSEILVEIALPAQFLYRATLKTSSGDLLLDPKSLRFDVLKAKTGLGDVNARLLDTVLARFSAKTGSGSVKAILPRSGGAIELTTGLGDVEAGIAAGLSVALATRTGLGDTTVRHPELTKLGKGRWTASGTGAHLEVDMNTGSGDIDVRPAA